MKLKYTVFYLKPIPGTNDLQVHQATFRKEQSAWTFARKYQTEVITLTK